MLTQRLQAGHTCSQLGRRPLGLYSHRPVRAAAEPRQDGEFGARDPFEAEITSNFGTKVLGFADTAHRVRAPEGMEELVGLAVKRCQPGEQAQPLSDAEATKLRNQVPGWQLVPSESGQLCLQFEWKALDAAAAQQLQQRLTDISAEAGHPCSLSLPSQASVSATCPPSGVLTYNDFVLAAKLNALDVRQYTVRPRARFWA